MASTLNFIPATRRPVALTVSITIARYVLGIVIITYGIGKLANGQMTVSSWTYAQPLIRTSGAMLTWAFLGYQPWFQFLLGVLETIPGVLLLFRRTWRLGALLLFPVMLNVVLINFALELWLDTRIVSSVLLSLNTFLLLCDLPMYRSFLAAILPRPEPLRSRGARGAATIAAVVVPVVSLVAFWMVFMSPAFTLFDNYSELTGVRQINGAGTWGVDRITIGGREIPGAADRRFYFDIFKKCAYKSGLEQSTGTLQVDRRAHTISISGLMLGGDASQINAAYNLDGNALIITGQRNGQPVEIILHRLKWGPMLPWGT